MWQYELYPSRLINVATPPCESLITAGYHQRKLHQMYHSFVKVGLRHHVPYIYLFGVLYSKACMKQRFMTSTTCENA